MNRTTTLTEVCEKARVESVEAASTRLLLLVFTHDSQLHVQEVRRIEHAWQRAIGGTVEGTVSVEAAAKLRGSCCCCQSHRSHDTL